MKQEDIEARKAANVLIEYCRNQECNECKIARFCNCWVSVGYRPSIVIKYRIPKETEQKQLRYIAVKIKGNDRFPAIPKRAIIHSSKNGYTTCCGIEINEKYVLFNNDNKKINCKDCLKK